MQQLRRLSQHTHRERLVGRLKSAYKHCWCLWAATKRNARYTVRDSDPCWQKIADYVIENGIDNCWEFFRCQFAVRASVGVAPQLRQCCGEAALARWQDRQKFKTQRGADIRQSLLSFQSFLNTELFKEQELRKISGQPDDTVAACVLGREDNSLSPLFRFCAATMIGEFDIAAKFQDLALLEYACDSNLYNGEWGPLIPAGLRNEFDIINGNIV